MEEFIKEIDAIDKGMRTLFLRRFEMSRKIGEYKMERNLEVLNKER